MSRLSVRLEKLARALLGKRREVKQIRRVLVAHQLLLGDTVLLAPLLKAIEQLAPHAERLVLCRPAYLPLFERHPYGFTALAYHRRDAMLERRVIDSGPFDLAVVVDDNRYAWLARAAGATWITGFAGDRRGWKNLMLDRALPYAPEPTAWADMLPGLVGIERVKPYLPGEWPAPQHAAYVQPARPYVVLHVGASSVLKQWPAARWRQVATMMRARGFALVWSGAASERAMLDAVAPPEAESVLFGSLDLAQLWHLLANSQALVSADTGVAHLARLTGVAATVIYGPASTTVHGLGDFFASAPIRILEAAAFPCRDQRVLYRRELKWVRRCGRSLGAAAGQCPEGLCMQAVSVERVMMSLPGARGKSTI